MSVSVTRCLLSVTCVALACVSAMSVSVENTLPATSSCVAILRGSDSLPTGTITGALLLICSALNLSQERVRVGGRDGEREGGGGGGRFAMEADVIYHSQVSFILRYS